MDIHIPGLALHNGPISVVQPLMVTELVFALVLRSLWVHQAITTVTWWAAGVSCVAPAVFIVMADPSGGSALPTSGAWVSAASATVGCVALSQPFIVIVDPIVSIALSVWIYGETFSATAARLAVGATAFATM